MNRRSFFASAAALAVAPSLVPAPKYVEAFDVWRIDPYTMKPHQYPSLPATPAGRLQAACDLFDQGLIDRDTFAELVGAP